MAILVPATFYMQFSQGSSRDSPTVINYSTHSFFNLFKSIQILYSFLLSLCALHEKFAHTVRKVVACRSAETHYNLHNPSRIPPRGFQSFNVNLIEEFELIILAVVITNASKSGRKDILEQLIL
jgi:hypothetical protein